MPNDPLEVIFVKPEQIEGEKRALLAKMLQPFVQIDPENGRIQLTLKGDKLNAKEKILIYLLSRLALFTFTEEKYPLATSPKEIENALNLPGGTIRPNLSQLVNERIAAKKGEGYYVPSQNLNRANEQLASKMRE